MSGIAELLVNLGYSVSGSDLKRSEATDRLAGLGVRIFEGHDRAQVGDADVLVYSSAVRPSNPELVEAARRRIPVIPRAEMLAELMRLRYGIAIAGAHGKTTTTSMIALVLDRAGLDPTAVIGGRLSAFGSSARLGRGDYMVAEADESDRSFLKLAPTIAVVTNIDEEHLESYCDFDDLQRSFVEFANKVPFYGVIVACIDDDRLRALVPAMSRRVITYGIEHPDADYRGVDLRVSGLGAGCRVVRRTPQGRAVDPAPGPTPVEIGALDLNVPGRHNLQNALAAVAVGEELGVGFDRIARALAEFRGVERRFQVRGEAGGVLIVDDYGHHPTEIAAVISSARAAFDRRLFVVFQPHRYSRTHRLLRRFGPSLAGADVLAVTDIYSAGEDPIVGVTTESLVDAIRGAVKVPLHVVGPIESVAREVASLARRGDVVILLGAGSIGAVSADLLDELRKREAAGGL